LFGRVILPARAALFEEHMKITLVKKIMEDGEECQKCREVSERLKFGDELRFIDRVIYADVRDAETEGSRLARELNVEIAPFFIVEKGGEKTIYKSYMVFKKNVLKKVLEAEDIEIEDKRKGTGDADAFGLSMAPSAANRKSSPDIDNLNKKFEGKSPQELLEWGLNAYHPDIALAWSGAEDVAIVDMMVKINPEARIFTLDTGRLNQETYDLIDAVRKKYSIQVEVLLPDSAEVEKMVRERGMNFFYEGAEERKFCCKVRKVEPLKKMLATLNGWITGLRRDQAVTRTALDKIEIDYAFGGILKLNPLADWSHDDVWDYIRKNDVPYNKLHDMGYPSIGCAPCTRAVEPGEDIRAGRWWWETPESKECGLHVKKKE